jgi:putative membrane protein
LAGSLLIFWGVILALIVMAVRWFTSGRPGGTQSTDATDILKSRFASGEIDEDEFRKRKAALED